MFSIVVILCLAVMLFPPKGPPTCAVLLAVFLSGCCLVRVPVACCMLPYHLWQVNEAQDDEVERARAYARDLSYAVEKYRADADRLDAQLKAKREQRERDADCDKWLTTRGETKRTMGAKGCPLKE